MEPTLQETTVVEYAGSRSGSGQFHGYGKAVFSSGQVYEGEWAQGHTEGTGRLAFPDGVTYEGSILSNKISGRGVYQWGNTIYEGEVLDGLRHGYGTLTFTDTPVVYEGEWWQGKRHGRGAIYYNADRTACYEGDWQDDMKHGQGNSIYPSGNSYSGSWVQDKREGTGTMTWLTKGQVYSGQWADDMPNGLGEHVWQQGMPGLQVSNHAMHVMFNRYFGMFKDGKRHGEGSLWYSSGARFEGQWEHDRKQGHGVYVFEDGSVFEGQFVADRPVLETGAFSGAASTFSAAVDSHGPDTATSRADSSAGATSQVQGEKVVGAAAGAEPGGEHGPSNAGDAAAAGGDSGAVGTGPVVNGPPGFGPRISALQLYIADLLQECDAPAATYKAVANLLVGYNTELRALYDRYCNRLSPLADPGAPRNSWALQAGQLWELLRDSQLLCRHVQLQQACQVLQRTLQPPPAVAQRREQVLATPDAPAVLSQPLQPYDPTTELLFRDFCELLVRLAAVRYPQLPCLEQQVQQVITQHLVPLLGGPNRQGGGRQSLLGRTSAVAAPQAGGVLSGPSLMGPEGPDQLQAEELVLYLQSQAGPLQQLFAAIASRDHCDQPVQNADHQQNQQISNSVARVMVEEQQEEVQEQGLGTADAWQGQVVTVRQVVRTLQQAGLLELWQLDAAAVAAVLLEGSLGITDPAGLRARMDEANQEPGSSDTQQLASSVAAAEAAAHQQLTYWMDAPLLLAELLWGLLRLASTQHQQQQQQQQQAAQGHGSSAPSLLIRVQALLEGAGGLFHLVLGLGTLQQQQQQEMQQPEEELRPEGGQHQEQEQGEQQEQAEQAAAADPQSLQQGWSQELQPSTDSASRPQTGQTEVAPSSRPLTGQSAGVMAVGGDGMQASGLGTPVAIGTVKGETYT